MHRQSKQITYSEPETWNFPALHAQCVLPTLFSEILKASLNIGGGKNEEQ